MVKIGRVPTMSRRERLARMRAERCTSSTQARLPPCPAFPPTSRRCPSPRQGQRSPTPSSDADGSSRAASPEITSTAQETQSSNREHTDISTERAVCQSHSAVDHSPHAANPVAVENSDEHLKSSRPSHAEQRDEAEASRARSRSVMPSSTENASSSTPMGPEIDQEHNASAGSSRADGQANTVDATTSSASPPLRSSQAFGKDVSAVLANKAANLNLKGLRMELDKIGLLLAEGRLLLAGLERKQANYLVARDEKYIPYAEQEIQTAEDALARAERNRELIKRNLGSHRRQLSEADQKFRETQVAFEKAHAKVTNARAEASPATSGPPAYNALP